MLQQCKWGRIRSSVDIFSIVDGKWENPFPKEAMWCCIQRKRMGDPTVGLSMVWFLKCQTGKSQRLMSYVYSQDGCSACIGNVAFPMLALSTCLILTCDRVYSPFKCYSGRQMSLYKKSLNFLGGMQGNRVSSHFESMLSFHFRHFLLLPPLGPDPVPIKISDLLGWSEYFIS